jgi:hypothetical protein
MPDGAAPPAREADLYAPLKAWLTGRGYAVKAEIGACDILAVPPGGPAVVIEMKRAFSLALVLQGVERQRLFDDVYLAVPQAAAPARDRVALCRRLGLGLMVVAPAGGVAVLADPGPYAPRRRKAQAARLLSEFARRAGDPETGGTPPRPRLTAYRQDALRLADALAALGADPGADAVPASPAALARATGVVRAGAILRDNHYGWFVRRARARYALTEAGAAARDQWAAARAHGAAADGGAGAEGPVP